MRRCAADVVRIFQRTAPLLRAMRASELTALGYPESTLTLLRRADLGAMPAVARVDMIARRDGSFAAIEINADTPAFVVETHRINAALCAEFSLDDPNAGAEATLRDALVRAVEAGAGAVRPDGLRRPFVAFTSVQRAIEDQETVRYQRELVAESGRFDTAFVPLHDLRIGPAGLYGADGRRIDVLYRHWPLEFFADDCDREAGVALGPLLFDAIDRGSVAIVNPPSGFLWQNKAAFAVIWALYESGHYFSAAEREAVNRSFLPTYLDPPPSAPYVVKPAFGREGASIDVVLPGATIASPVRSFDAAIKVYQAYVEMPTVEAMTTAGRRTMHALHTCFVAGGTPSAVGLRLGGAITDDAAYFIGIGLGRD